MNVVDSVASQVLAQDAGSGFDWGGFTFVTVTSLIAIALLIVVTAVFGFRLGRHNVVDVSWGIGFVVIALVSAVFGDGDLWRRWLLAALIAVWGLRLAWHMARRGRGRGEDPRYEKMLDDAGGNRTRAAIRKIYFTQGIALWFVSLPVQVSAVTQGPLGVLTVVGILLWVTGFTFESVGDAQMSAFKADPANRGTIMNRGLWGWTRHPNYFGDACIWWGIFLISAQTWPGVLTVLSPVAMTYFLVYATGARRLERHMAERPGYPDYQESTSYFLPRPPRR
ncbi:DUF1295 domain-containing protein [Rhodococcus spongiicola]|uniref:DUF1295 domain-containing protein n=1 Tax=Rhodococcus spongiicola TaxID=2487352 RepID=A0A3S3A9D3_9NOCA|nr:DUF1295 domain-containing protein [Rhodococcus spongiicola]RVW05003.1 DUF1295 domain-containing protein [Rhodococcus spongiicola]